MIAKIKWYALLLVAISMVVFFVSRFLNNHSFVSNKFIKQKTDSISTLKHKVYVLDSLAWSLQQDIDIAKSNESLFQTSMAAYKKQAMEALAAEKRAAEAIEHYESNGLIRYFILDKRGIFRKGCYQEVFEKPENICK